jgi:hypothetical protein
MWVQKLGACPSFEDYLNFGSNLDDPKFGKQRYVGAKAIQFYGSDAPVLHIGDFSQGTNKRHGRQIIID